MLVHFAEKITAGPVVIAQVRNINGDFTRETLRQCLAPTPIYLLNSSVGKITRDFDAVLIRTIIDMKDGHALFLDG